MTNMKKRRRFLRLTQVAVSVQTGIDQSLISKYERGDRLPTLENLMKLAGLYGTSLDYLAGLTDESLPYPPKESSN